MVKQGNHSLTGEAQKAASQGDSLPKPTPLPDVDLTRFRELLETMPLQNVDKVSGADVAMAQVHASRALLEQCYQQPAVPHPVIDAPSCQHCGMATEKALVPTR